MQALCYVEKNLSLTNDGISETVYALQEGAGDLQVIE